ncbi:MAG: Maf family protein, partial [Flavihumibacter sp.]
MELILASQSPRRKQLLEWAEIDFTVQVLPTDESYPPGLAANDVPVYIARNKCIAVQQQAGAQAVVLAADTVVVLENTIIGKPVDAADAVQILQSLS